jgi:hypothetical protein
VRSGCVVPLCGGAELVCCAATFAWLCAVAVSTAANKIIDAAITHIDRPEATANVCCIKGLRKNSRRTDADLTPLTPLASDQ